MTESDENDEIPIEPIVEEGRETLTSDSKDETSKEEVSTEQMPTQQSPIEPTQETPSVFEESTPQTFRSNLSENLQRKKFSLPLLLTLGACFLLGVISVLFWSDGPQSFPRITAGTYVGKIEGVYPSPVPLFLDKAENSDSVFIVVLKSGFAPQTISLITQGTSASDNSTFLPVTIEGRGNKLKFLGTEEQSSTYHGIVYNLETGNEGTWELHLLETTEEREDATEVADIRLWLLLRSELSDVEQKLTKLQTRIPISEGEASKLSQFITDGQSLKSNAGRKLALEKESLSKLQAEYKTKQEEVSKLERQVDLAHRVTSMGKLVSLARESLEREGRWISSSLRVGTGDLPPELEEAAIKGERILEVKRQIEIENERIYSLMHPEERQIDTTNDEDIEIDHDKSKKSKGKKEEGLWDRLFGGDEDE